MTLDLITQALVKNGADPEDAKDYATRAVAKAITRNKPKSKGKSSS
jgi:hypothetical protein